MRTARAESPPKVLVAIASYGEKNLSYLSKVVRAYKAMRLDVRIIVTADAPKSIDLGVEVRVGTPTRDPRSLPFAHKQVFAENLDRYDLFIYTEDDIGVTENHIRAFAKVSRVLQSDEIAGYMRYELAGDGERTVPDVHGRFHWDPTSVTRRGDYTLAHFSNEHAGFYVVSQEQLRRAIGRGRFLCQPYQGRYEMLESAATDVYANCGFRKMICLSHLEDFMVHHMPDRYAGSLGVRWSAFKEQIDTLFEIEQGRHPATILFDVEPKGLAFEWAKRYDERPSTELLSMLPEVRSVLSVGCGFGATEQALARRGASVTVFPLDSVVGAQMERPGMEVVYGTLEHCLRSVGDRQFDLVLLSNLLHLLPRPVASLERFVTLIKPGGGLVIEGRNADRLSDAMRRPTLGFHLRSRGADSDRLLRASAAGAVKRLAEKAGLSVRELRWVDCHLPWPATSLARWCGRFAARTWILHAERPFSSDCGRSSIDSQRVLG